MRFSTAPGGPHRGRHRASARLVAALGLGLGLALTARSAAQGPTGPAPATAPPTISGIAPRLPMPPDTKDFPPTSEFIEGLGAPTSFLEVKVGQGRFLALRENLVVPGQPAPFLAVGDPGVLD